MCNNILKSTRWAIEVWFAFVVAVSSLTGLSQNALWEFFVELNNTTYRNRFVCSSSFDWANWIQFTFFFVKLFTMFTDLCHITHTGVSNTLVVNCFICVGRFPHRASGVWSPVWHDYEASLPFLSLFFILSWTNHWYVLCCYWSSRFNNLIKVCVSSNVRKMASNNELSKRQNVKGGRIMRGWIWVSLVAYRVDVDSFVHDSHLYKAHACWNVICYNDGGANLWSWSCGWIWWINQL